MNTIKEKGCVSMKIQAVLFVKCSTGRCGKYVTFRMIVKHEKTIHHFLVNTAIDKLILVNVKYDVS